MARHFAAGEGGGARVCVHCFTGDEQDLRQVLATGASVGFTGYVGMQRRATETGTLAAIAALHGSGQLPLGRVMIETDAPFMCPDKAWLPPGAGFARKGQCEPAFAPAVCRALAAALGAAGRGTSTTARPRPGLRPLGAVKRP